MKKWFCTILAVVLLCSTMACAEEFTLRNGIKFGDSIEEVLSKETIQIKSIDDGTEEEAEDAAEEAVGDTAEETVDESTDSEQETAETAEESGENEEATEAKYPYSITTEDATVAGIGDSYIWYKFDAEQKLREVDYYFRSSSYKDTIDNDFESVNSALIRKYGNPLGYSGGDCYIFTGSALQGAVLSAYIFKYLDGYGDIRDYDEWDVKADSHHVKIEQVEYYYGNSYSELTYAHRMSYTYFTDDDLLAAQQEKHANQAAIDSDI